MKNYWNSQLIPKSSFLTLRKNSYNFQITLSELLEMRLRKKLLSTANAKIWIILHKLNPNSIQMSSFISLPNRLLMKFKNLFSLFYSLVNKYMAYYREESSFTSPSPLKNWINLLFFIRSLVLFCLSSDLFCSSYLTKNRNFFQY